MNQPPTSPVSEHERAVIRHFEEEASLRFYLDGWHPDHIHFGLFEEGECLEKGERLHGSPKFASAVERMVEAIVSPAAIREGHHVVDAGCGVGGTAMYLARTRGCTVTGVDVSSVHLERARQKAVDAGLGDRVDFAHGDCSRRLPFADGSVDTVVNIESACHYSDRAQFLREVRRILKPGGRIAASDWMVRDGLTADEHERFIGPVLRPRGLSGLPEGSLPWGVSSMESLSTYAGRLRETGLAIMEIKGFDGRDAANIQILENLHRLTMMLWFAGRATERHRRTMDRCGALCAAWRGGYFQLGRYCAEKPG